ncbi:MAG: hypothetical protein [Bacteriophage sp.]|nr:MAG: hypothetical protein [Bacteriophage sp.]
MKSFASKFNKTTFGIDTTDFQYTKLADIYNSESEGGNDVVHKINGLYVHKSKLGDSPVIIDGENKRLVNLPSHTAETVREILADDEAVETIKAGKVGYTIYEFESHAKKCYSISFVDL